MTNLNLTDIRSNEELVSIMQSGTKVEFIFFYGHFVPRDGRAGESCLSQWYPISFEIDGVSYPTAEHYMMAEKARLFNDVDSLEKIFKVSSPREAKKLGGNVSNFDRETWDKKCFDIIVSGNMAKFRQNFKLGKFLKYSGGKVLVEANPRDKVLGIGMSSKNEKAKLPENWKGSNLLGYALMEVRARLKETSD